jgi:uncharacterized caspase-like protein
VLQDQSDLATVYRALRRYARLAEDTLIVYFAGHGRRSHRDELYLGLTGTDPDELQVSALPYELVRDAFAECPAANRVLILDCCFSGMALRDMSSDTTSQFAVEGSYILTASPATETETDEADRVVDCRRDGRRHRGHGGFLERWRPTVRCHR